MTRSGPSRTSIEPPCPIYYLYLPRAGSSKVGRGKAEIGDDSRHKYKENILKLIVG